MPKCPHSDFYYSKVPEPQPVSQENADDMLSSEEAAGADGDPPLDSSGEVEPTVEETVGANFSANMKSSVPGSVQETIYMDGSSHPTHPVSKGVAKVELVPTVKSEIGIGGSPSTIIVCFSTTKFCRFFPEPKRIVDRNFNLLSLYDPRG